MTVSQERLDQFQPNFVEVILVSIGPSQAIFLKILQRELVPAKNGLKLKLQVSFPDSGRFGSYHYKKLRSIKKVIGF